MNEACAAGTGSFLEEQAEKLGIAIIGEFAELALSVDGPDPPRRALHRVHGARRRSATSSAARAREDLVAGLAYSIVYNYLNRVVRERTIGDCIFFQGGTAYNDAVAAAFAMILGKEIIVPPHNGVIGAIGMALLAARAHASAPARSTQVPRLRTSTAVDYTSREFTCKGCSNDCDIQEFTSRARRPTGATSAPTATASGPRSTSEPVIDDLIALREQSAAGAVRARRRAGRPTRTTVGHPAGHVRVRPPAVLGDASSPSSVCGRVLSTETDRERSARRASTAPWPSRASRSRVAHGHVDWLAERRASTTSSLPNILSRRPSSWTINSHVCPWGQTLPFVVRSAPRLEQHRDRIPHARGALPRAACERRRRRTLAPLAKPARRASERRCAAALQRAQPRRTRSAIALLAAGPRRWRRSSASGELGHRPRRPAVQHVRHGRQPGHRRASCASTTASTACRSTSCRSSGIDVTGVVPNMYWNYGRKILQAATLRRPTTTTCTSSTSPTSSAGPTRTSSTSCARPPASRS